MNTFLKLSYIVDMLYQVCTWYVVGVYGCYSRSTAAVTKGWRALPGTAVDPKGSRLVWWPAGRDSKYCP